MSYEYEDSLPPDAKHRYTTKIQLAGMEMCPYKLPSDRWVNDVKSWPAVNYKDVYTYLIKSPRLYSQEAMENYRSLEAHTFFVSGWVQTVFHITTITGNFVLKADVKPSWRVTDDPHHPWVCLSKVGSVISAHCDCKAGLGETCSHVGAVLFKLEAAVRLGLTTTACTDQPCVWNECFVKNVLPAKISEIEFYKVEAKEKVRKAKSKKAKTMPAAATTAEQTEFLSALFHSSKDSVCFSTFKDFSTGFIALGPEPIEKKLPPPLRNLYSTEYSKLSSEQLTTASADVKDKMKLSESEVSYVEEATRNQSSSSVWHAQRTGRITASVAGDCMKTNEIRPAPSLIKKICVPNNKKINAAAVAWGNAHELDGFRMFSLLYTGSGTSPTVNPSGEVYVTTGCGHKDSSVTMSGLVLHKDYPYLGASPDGIINCSCCGKGVLEIKCPFKFKDKCMKDILADKKLNMKTGHKYYSQIQLQMVLCEASFADFLIWTPIDCLIIRVRENKMYQEKMLEKLSSFWTRHILPELLTRRNELSDEMPSTTGANVSECDSNIIISYCVCKATEDSGDMVGCDRCDQWYHPKCLGLKRLPSAKTWYCRECKKSMKT